MSLAQSAVFLFSCPISIVIRVLLIDSVLAALGAASIKLAVSGVKNYVNSFEKWKDASDYYVIIRTFGKKL